LNGDRRVIQPSGNEEAGQKIVIPEDGYTVNPATTMDGLARLGELIAYDRTSPYNIVERGADADIILTNKTPLRAETLAQLPRPASSPNLPQVTTM
jgi:hypothetical protein